MTQPPIPPAGGPPPWPSQYPPPPPGFGPPPPKKSSRTPWIIVGISLVAVVALVAGLLVWKGTSGGESGTGDPSTIADDGIDRTVGLLREKDPVCDDWSLYASEFGRVTEEWSAVDQSVPAAAWDAEQRRVFEKAGEAMSGAAVRFEAILPKAQNFAMRELIAQAVVYMRMYVERLPKYDGNDDARISGVAINFLNAVANMCAAIPLTPAPNPDDYTWQSSVEQPGALSDFVPKRDEVCLEVLEIIDRQSTLLGGWSKTDASKDAFQWTSEERALFNAAKVVLSDDSEQLRKIADRAQGRIIGDLLVLQSAYMQAYAEAIPTYTADDRLLWQVVIRVGGGLNAACEVKQ